MSTSIDTPENPTAEPYSFNPDVMPHKIHEVETVEAGSTTNDPELLVYSQRHPPNMDKSKDVHCQESDQNVYSNPELKYPIHLLLTDKSTN